MCRAGEFYLLSRESTCMRDKWWDKILGQTISALMFVRKNNSLICAQKAKAPQNISISQKKWIWKMPWNILAMMSWLKLRQKTLESEKFVLIKRPLRERPKTLYYD